MQTPGTAAPVPGPDVDELYRRLERLRHVGVVPGAGLWRRALTAEDAEAVALVAGWMRAAGLSVRRDAAGNLFGRMPGRLAGQVPAPLAGPAEGCADAAAAVLVGSHLDTVRDGGAFDGALGVLAALGAVELLLRAHGEPQRPVEVVVWTGEEGSRFPQGCIGSRGFAAQLGAPDLEQRDDEGVSLRDALRAAGCDPEQLPRAPRSDVAAYLELHIEQGSVLETSGDEVGIVDAIMGRTLVEVGVEGVAAHAGGTPMRLRHDALRSAAEMIVAAAERVEAAGPPAVVTCGRLEVGPGAANVVPGGVCFTLDLRDTDADRRLRLEAELADDCRRLAARRGCSLQWGRLQDVPPATCHRGLVSLLEEETHRCGLRGARLVSGAGHDAMVLAPLYPTAMVFVPCRGGRSHCPEEHVAPEQAEPGLRILAAALRRLAWDPAGARAAAPATDSGAGVAGAASRDAADGGASGSALPVDPGGAGRTGGAPGAGGTGGKGA